MPKYYTILLILTTIFIGLSCIFTSTLKDILQRDQRYDIDVLTDSTCIYDCWQGLELGKSTTEDLHNFLDTNQNVSDIRFPNDISPHPNLFAEFAYNSVWTRFYVYSDTNQLYLISFIRNIDLTAATIMNTLGEPDYQHITDVRNDNDPLVAVRLYYFEQGYVFEFSIREENDAYCIESNSYVDGIGISETGEIVTLLTRGISRSPRDFSQLEIDNLMNDLSPWQGYGCY